MKSVLLTMVLGLVLFSCSNTQTAEQSAKSSESKSSEPRTVEYFKNADREATTKYFEENCNEFMIIRKSITDKELIECSNIRLAYQPTW